jgi:photosystem II stability/assembly factor-like uncharacterized protein
MFLLLAGCAGVALASDGWVATKQGPPGKDLNTVYFADAKHGWIAGDGGFVMSTTDGGKSWTQQQVDTDHAINDIYFRNKEEGYLLAGNRIFSTENGGRVWREVRRFLPADFNGAEPELYSVRFASKKKGWIVGSISRRNKVVNSLVLQTKDGGASWQRLVVPTRDELINLDFINNERGWVVGASGTILHTRDGGMTWIPQRSNTDVTLYSVDFRGDRKGWAVGEKGTILRTTDGGETWIPTTALVHATLLSVRFLDDDNGWIAGHGGVILRTGDGGASWVQQDSKTTRNIYALYIDKHAGWAVGGDGTVLVYEL